MNTTTLRAIMALTLSVTGCAAEAAPGIYEREDLRQQQLALEPQLGPPETVGELRHRGRTLRILRRMLPAGVAGPDGIAAPEPRAFHGVSDPPRPTLWLPVNIHALTGLGAVAILENTGPIYKRQGRCTNVILYDPESATWPPESGKFLDWGWTSFADHGWAGEDRGFFVKEGEEQGLYGSTPGTPLEAYVVHCDAGVVRRFRKLAFVDDDGDGWRRWHWRFPNGRLAFVGLDARPTGEVRFLPQLVDHDLRLIDGADAVLRSEKSATGLAFDFSAPSPLNPNLRAVVQPDGSIAIPDGSVGMAPGKHPLFGTLLLWLVAYPTDEGLLWGWTTTDHARWSGPIWRDVRFAPRSRYFYHARLTPEGRVEGADAVLLAQGLDRQWQTVVMASPPAPALLPPSYHPDPVSAFEHSEHVAGGQCAPLFEQVAARQRRIEEALAAQRAAERAYQPPMSTWDYLWHGTPVYESQIRLGEFTSEVEARQRQVIREYRERGVYDLYGRPHDYLNDDRPGAR